VTRSRLSILALVSVALLLSACTECGGQCSAPYELDVMFVAGTSIPTARTVLQNCAHDPEVVSVSSPKVEYGHGSQPSAVVWTRDYGGKKTKSLSTCPWSSPCVQGTAYPS
jgi:hypothetical protein